MALVNEVLSEIQEVMTQVDDAQLDAAENIITKDKRIFVLGAGRSGLMVKGFAMRLMHIGYTVFVIGETITLQLLKAMSWWLSQVLGQPVQLLALHKRPLTMVST